MFQHICSGVLLPTAENKIRWFLEVGLQVFKGPFVITMGPVSTKSEF